MGSLYTTKADRVSKYLEDNGYKYQSTIQNFTIYKQDGGDEMIFVGSRGNVKKGTNFKSSVAIPNSTVNEWIKNYA